MIFSSNLHTKVLSGRKSEHRYPVTDSLPCRWRRGNTYAVQSHAGGSRLGTVRILASDKQRLDEISEESARREGFADREQFVEHWCQLYGEFVPEQEVWVLVFVPERDETRLLAKDSTRGYTSDPRMALSEEPEAVDADTQGRITAEATERFDSVRAEELARREMRSYLAQIRQAGTEQLRSGRDPRPALKQALEQLSDQEAA